jgi:hypothetical protein
MFWLRYREGAFGPVTFYVNTDKSRYWAQVNSVKSMKEGAFPSFGFGLVFAIVREKNVVNVECEHHSVS